MKWNQGAQFENPPAGNHIARCYALVDLGTQQHSFNNETWAARDVRLSFELPGELMTGKYNQEVKGKPFAVHWTGKQSLHVNAKLRKLLEGWRGKKFDQDTIAKFDPQKLVGLPCRVTLVENGDYVNIESVSPLAKTDKCPKQVNPSVYFSLETDEFDSDVFDALGEKTREKIAKSPEFIALENGTAEAEAPQADPTSDDGKDPF